MLDLLSPDNARIMMGLAFFPIGLVAIASGLIMLVAGPYRKEAKQLAAQSVRIGSLRYNPDQKNFADGLNTLTQSATALIESVHKLIQTSAGNAIVVIGVGMLFEAAAYWLLVASA